MSRKNTSEKTEGFTPHDFAIKQMLGTGKFSNVFKAINKETDFTVALKLMAKIVIENSKIYRQVQRQIQIQHRLKHPNICQLFAYFQDENNLYIVLEYCANGSLASIIKDKHQKLEEKRIAKIVLQLFQALAYMHERNVMHRDLKLQNILLDQNDNIKISDFGCCRHHALSRDTFCGTLEYISPEMLNKEKYNHSIDIYCVGVILYQLFYFVSPFVGNNKEETFNNINEGKFTFKDQIRQISKQAKDLIILLLQKDPTKRPKAKDIFNHKFIQKYSTSSINRPQQNNQMLSRQELVVGLQNVQQNAGNIQQNSFSLRLYPDLQK